MHVVLLLLCLSLLVFAAFAGRGGTGEVIEGTKKLCAVADALVGYIQGLCCRDFPHTLLTVKVLFVGLNKMVQDGLSAVGKAMTGNSAPMVSNAAYILSTVLQTPRKQNRVLK